ncbi:uncharacterized protein GJ701_012053 isoform 1-T6 [Geothlypis trichas]
MWRSARPANGGASRPLPRLRARHSAGRAHGSRPLLLEQRRLRRAPPGMAATAAPESGQRGGPGAGPAEPINSLARLSAASCSGSAEVGAGTAGRERSGVPPAPSPGVGQASAGGQRRLCARPSAGAAPRRVTASLPLGPGPVRKGASAGSGRCPAQLTRSSPGALVEVMTLSRQSGSVDYCCPSQVVSDVPANRPRAGVDRPLLPVLTVRCFSVGRRSPGRLREPRARSQAGHEGASPACAGRPEPLPGPGG